MAEVPLTQAERGSRYDRPHLLLIGVCVLHAVSPLLLVGLHHWYGWDETVYISQINRYVPAGAFSAPRARGLPLLVAPVSMLTGSLAAMRLWLSLLSGLGLYAFLRPWQHLRPGGVVPLAGLLWSSLWISILYSFEAMPNQYLAYGVGAAAGCLLLALRDPHRRRLFWLTGIALAAAALMRPSDTLFAAVALAVMAVVVPGVARRTRGRLLLAIVLGVAVGWSEWIVEAYTRFGGPLARFKAAGTENATGLHVSLGAQMRTLAGPLLCRAGCHVSAAPVYRLWWFALVPLTVFGLWVARRRGWFWLHLTAVAVAVAVLLQYAFAVSYSAPRFLLPTYALLALPIAEGAAAIPQLVGRQWRPVLVGGLVAVFLGHTAVQVVALRRDVLPHVRADGRRFVAVGKWLNAHGISGRCLVTGADNGPYSFAARCDDNAHRRKTIASELADGAAVAVVTDSPAPPDAYYRTWRMLPIVAPGVPPGWRAWIDIPPGHRASGS